MWPCMSRWSIRPNRRRLKDGCFGSRGVPGTRYRASEWIGNRLATIIVVGDEPRHARPDMIVVPRARLAGPSPGPRLRMGLPQLVRCARGGSDHLASVDHCQAALPKYADFRRRCHQFVTDRERYRRSGLWGRLWVASRLAAQVPNVRFDQRVKIGQGPLMTLGNAACVRLIVWCMTGTARREQGCRR